MTRPSASDLTARALVAWIATRVSVAVLSLAALWTTTGSTAGDVTHWLTGWDRWDTGLFVKVARYGYDGYPRHYPDQGTVAFFPGEPLALRAVHLVQRNWGASGLLISAGGGAGRPWAPAAPSGPGGVPQGPAAG